MMTKDAEAIKARTRELLIKGEMTLLEIAKEVGRGKTYVSRAKTELEAELENGAEQSISSLSPNLVLKMADKMAETHPAMSKDLTNLAGGIASMHRLEPRLHQAIETLVDRCEKAMEVEKLKPSDFKMYAELILKSYATALHKGATTQINVNQTQNNAVLQQAVTDRLAHLTSGIFEGEINED